MKAELKPKIILILGMHRSGTSLVAQLIAKWGAYMGKDLMPANIYNQDGYWEYNPLVDFHEKLLKKTNNKWFAPSEEINVNELINEFGKEAQKLVEQMDKTGRDWCWKDPRMILFIDFWKAILVGRDISFVITNRSLESVASSLFSRDKLPSNISIALWEFSTYKIIEALSSEIKYILIDYDQIIAEPEITITKLFHFLNNSFGIHENQEVYDNMLLSVKKSLNHVKPNSAIRINKLQNDLQKVIGKDKIPEDYKVPENQISYLQEIFAYFRKIPVENLGWQSAQLYFRNESTEFNENQSLIQEIRGNSKIISFKFGNQLFVRQLRFDPLNDCVRIRINKIQLLNQGNPLEIELRLSSNAINSENRIYLFDTTDPQIFVDFPLENRVEIDEVIVDLEYLQKGYGILEDLLKQKNIEIEAHDEKTLNLNTLLQTTKDLNDCLEKELSENNIALQKQSEKIKLQNETILSQKRTTDELMNQLNNLKSRIQSNNSELISIKRSHTYRLSKFLESPLLLFRPFKLKGLITGKLILMRNIKLLKQSSYFDSDYYLKTNPDVKAIGMSAIKHYLLFGGIEGRKPCMDFDSSFYLEQNSDVKASTMNPLVHYLLFGQKEGRIIQETSNNKPIDDNLETYTNWIEKFDTLSIENLVEMSEKVSDFHYKPLISVLMPIYDPDPQFLSEAIESVIRQVYPCWELCIADDCSTNPEIRKILIKYKEQDSRIKIVFRASNGHISKASNSALELVTGEFIALLDHDDVIPAHALFTITETVNKYPNAKLIYSDEDKIDGKNERSNPYFKCDWNQELFYSQNLISHLGVYSTKIVKLIGGFREGFEGSQDYDLALRFIEKTRNEDIIHIPKVLYHWRMHEQSVALNVNSKNYAYQAAMNALKEHFDRKGIIASVVSITTGLYKIQYSLPENNPLVSIIIPTKNKFELLKKCVDSIMTLTNYKNIEIIIIDNQSDEYESIEYLHELSNSKKAQCLMYDIPFNFSKLVNYGVNHSKGEFICLMNNDIEVINPEWLDEMVSLAKFNDVGAVGAKLLYPNNTIQHGGVILGIGGVASHAHKFMHANQFGYFGRAVVVQQFSAVTAACLLIKKSIFTEIGGFNEKDLTIAFNDVDFCLRIGQAGYRNVWTPFAQLYHHESVTRGIEDTEEKKLRFQKEIEFMYSNWKHLIDNDPAYNPNLTLNSENFNLAWPPRNIAFNGLNPFQKKS